MITVTLKANTQELLNDFSPTGYRESSLYLATLSCEYFSSPSAEYLFLCWIIVFIQNVKNDSIEKKLSIGRAFFFSLSSDLARCWCVQVLSIHFFFAFDSLASSFLCPYKNGLEDKEVQSWRLESAILSGPGAWINLFSFTPAKKIKNR